MVFLILSSRGLGSWDGWFGQAASPLEGPSRHHLSILHSAGPALPLHPTAPALCLRFPPATKMPPAYTTAQKSAIQQVVNFTSCDRTTAARVSRPPCTPSRSRADMSARFSGTTTGTQSKPSTGTFRRSFLLRPLAVARRRRIGCRKTASRRIRGCADKNSGLRQRSRVVSWHTIATTARCRCALFSPSRPAARF